MKRATIWIVGLAVMIGAAMAARLAVQAGAIGAGYAAKQICSGVFVARLPEQFVVETDVLPRLATVGPLPQLLDYALDTNEQRVVASLLGQTATAQHQARYGCALGEAGVRSGDRLIARMREGSCTPVVEQVLHVRLPAPPPASSGASYPRRSATARCRCRGLSTRIDPNPP